ncbi:acetoacetate--CoA ligase [Streptomyces sp. NBC_00147]|uniref:acetoacetate--CoA ligase n=1 Tax=Streptomyces sp. NBC_00147 TaxID=2975667 RepID=UPI002F915518
MSTANDLLWSPAPSAAENSDVAAFMRWLGKTRGLSFTDYTDLWKWSTDDLPAFWSAVWEYYGLDAVSGYEEVLSDASMPGASWFPGARLNFAQQCFAHASDTRPALITVPESGVPLEMSWERLRLEVAAVAASLREMGVGPGDRVAGYLPNISHAVIALLATAAVGAVWTVCSPDFGTPSVLTRFQQAQPTVLLAADGYRYGGKEFDRRPAVAQIIDELPTVRHLIAIDHLFASSAASAWTRRPDVVQHPWSALLENRRELGFADVTFDHPLWILWSSGTTGVPKGIVQSHGGITVEMLKSLGLGLDLRSDDRYFFHTSTSWMVWNHLVGALLHGATIVLYDGSPTFPDVNRVWKVAEQTRATMVGVGAAYLVAGEKADAHPAAETDLTALRSIVQTGSSLPPSTWRWVYDRVRSDVWLQSLCGGTDICSALAGGSPLLPVRVGRIQCPALGVALAAWDPAGRPIVGEQGELVVTAPLPSMPVRFVNDPGNRRYTESYFSVYPGVWRHGDWATVHPDLSVEIAGRSDSTLNRMGIRMGSADIYAVVEQLPYIADSLVIGSEMPDGRYLILLFVVLAEESGLDGTVREDIVKAIRASLSPRHVPDSIVAIDAVPRTLTGKKLEVPVKRIIQGARFTDVAAEGATTHPEMLSWFAEFAKDPEAIASGPS